MKDDLADPYTTHMAPDAVIAVGLGLTNECNLSCAFCYCYPTRTDRLSLDQVYFVSSRRRHTRFDCDWSSDVCSSDLIGDHLQHAGMRQVQRVPGAGIVDVV